MNGFQITFFLQQAQRHGGKPLCEWLLELAKELDLHGATLLAAQQGFGRSGRMHSARFFELADQPLQFVTIVTAEAADQLFARLRSENLRLFYVKTPAEFGVSGDGEMD